MRTRLERLLADDHIAVVETVIAYLRSRSPRRVPTTEIAAAINRPKSQVYGLVKKGRELLALTTGEFIPNIAKRKANLPNGYTVTNDARAAQFEANKSFDRGDGHYTAGIATQRRVALSSMSTPEDIALWLSTQSRADAASLALKASERAKTVAALSPNNKRLSLAAKAEAVTPWETLGLTNHHHEDDDSDDES